MGREQGLGLGLGAPAGPGCRAAPAPRRHRAPPPPSAPQPHVSPTLVGQRWGGPVPHCPVLPSPRGTLTQGTAQAGARAAAPSTPSPRPPMGPEPPVGLGVCRGSGPLAGRRLSLQRWRQGQGCVQQLPPRHTASCPCTPSLPATNTGQGHLRQMGSTAAAPLLHPPVSLSTPGWRGNILPWCGAQGMSRRCWQGQVPAGRAY